MSDTAIIKIISKTHVAIVTVLSIIGLTSLLIFLTLQEGIVVERLLLPGFKIEQLYIKWNEKLSLTADEIIITKSNSEPHGKFDPDLVRKLFGSIKYFEAWIEHIAIDKMLIDDNDVMFSYTHGEDATITLNSPLFKADAKLRWDEPYFLADLTLLDIQRDIEIKGTSVVDLDQFVSYSRLDIIPAKAAELILYLEADREALSFATVSNRPITDLRPIVDLFGLHEQVTPWIVDYSFGSTFELHTLTGNMRYDTPGQLMDTLYAHATYKDFIYKFQSGLPPIRTSHTEFIFKEGVLDILPRDSYYRDHRMQDSWLDIDFNPERGPVLNAYITTTTPFDQELVDLLDHFKIPLPFVQSKGTMDADLTLNIPLLDVKHLQANGTFAIKKGEVDYEGIPLKVTDSAITIHNSSVKVDRVNIGYEEMLKASAKGVMDFGKSRTDLRIKVNKVAFEIGESRLSLDNKTTQLMIDYRLSSKAETVALSPSRWTADEKIIEVQPFTAPFVFDTASIILSKVSASLDEVAKVAISGPIHLKKQKVALNIDVLDFKLDDFSLAQKRFPLSIEYDDGLTIDSHHEVNWDFDGTPITIGPSSLIVDGDLLKVDNAGFVIANILESSIDGSYDYKTEQGRFDLHHLMLSDKSPGDLFYSSEVIPIDMVIGRKGTYITVPLLGLDLESEHDGWTLSLSDLKRFAKHSELMQRQNLVSGKLSVKKRASKPYQFKGKIDYPYPLLVKDDVPVNNITFNGTHKDGVTDIDLLEQVNIRIGSDINISSDGIGFDIASINAYVHDHNGEASVNTDLPDISMIANNSYLYFSDRSKALADTLTLDMYQESLTASLIYKEGVAIFEFKDGSFYADGQLFDDKFMTTLFPASSYEGGYMLFNVNGTLDHADGIIYLENTILKDYKALNNILAFINTVPSLVTFSLPSYATKGIEVSEAYSNFTYKDEKVYFNTIKFDSPEMKIVGNGITDYPNNTVDMNMTFKTDLGSSISKIPLVGYLLLGEDGSIATSFKVTGELDDPEVETQTVQDIVVAPFNIIKRAVTLPFWIFDDD